MPGIQEFLMDTEKKRGRGPAFKGLFHEPEQAVAAPQPGWEPLPPGSWLGVLGGGQLGRMFCQAAQRLGYRVCVLDPELDGIASRVADRHICAAYLDEAALQELGELCQAVTTEFENVPAAALERLAALTRVAPAARSVATAQDRVVEKAFFVEAGVPVADYRVVMTDEDVEGLPGHLFPGILKVARLGYDGKGQARVASLQEARAAFQRFTEAAGGRPPVCVLEEQVDLAAEVSVLLARGSDGKVAVYPVAANEHRNGILAVTTVPAPEPVTPALARRASELATAIASRLDYHGVLCVEFFILKDGRLLANEMAPRPHNSGHWTLDAAGCSQFEQQARVMAGLPLGDTRHTRPVIMLNILGDAWYRRPPQAHRSAAAAGGAMPDPSAKIEPDWPGVLAVPGAHLHLYGKDDARRGRKMGHVNITATTVAAVHGKAETVGALVAQPLKG
jgi:phosphoribosylaminoimidazole carboxylase, ATPase subunit